MYTAYLGCCIHGSSKSLRTTRIIATCIVLHLFWEPLYTHSAHKKFHRMLQIVMSETGDTNQSNIFTIGVAVTGVLYFMFLTYVAVQAEQYSFRVAKDNNHRNETCSITPSVRCLTVNIKSVSDHDKTLNTRVISFEDGESENTLINIVNRNIQVTTWTDTNHFILERFTEDYRKEGSENTINQLIAYTILKDDLESKKDEYSKKVSEIVFPWKSDFTVPYFSNGSYTLCVISRY
jgi:hypothetical protein